MRQVNTRFFAARVLAVFLCLLLLVTAVPQASARYQISAKSVGVIGPLDHSDKSDLLVTGGQRVLLTEWLPLSDPESGLSGMVSLLLGEEDGSLRPEEEGEPVPPTWGSYEFTVAAEGAVSSELSLSWTPEDAAEAFCHVEEDEIRVTVLPTEKTGEAGEVTVTVSWEKMKLSADFVIPVREEPAAVELPEGEPDDSLDFTGLTPGHYAIRFPETAEYQLCLRRENERLPKLRSGAGGSEAWTLDAEHELFTFQSAEENARILLLDLTDPVYRNSEDGTLDFSLEVYGPGLTDEKTGQSRLSFEQFPMDGKTRIYLSGDEFLLDVPTNWFGSSLSCLAEDSFTAQLQLTGQGIEVNAKEVPSGLYKLELNWTVSDVSIVTETMTLYVTH